MATVGIGALLFASGNSQAASVGRLLQGAGGVFALIGAAYIAILAILVIGVINTGQFIEAAQIGGGLR